MRGPRYEIGFISYLNLSGPANSGYNLVVLDCSRQMQDWYKDAIIYEVHVRAFFDSVTDGIGDFGGLTQKLPYLEDLGVTAIWLLPFSPSPLKDDGYDTSDYTDIHPSYGSLKDFQRFMLSLIHI